LLFQKHARVISGINNTLAIIGSLRPSRCLWRDRSRRNTDPQKFHAPRRRNRAVAKAKKPGAAGRFDEYLL
jgi:hypothetical protein